MIPVKYRHVCIVFLKQVWSSIRNALPVVTWPSRVGSNVAPAPQDTGPAAAVSPDPTAAEDTLALIAAHLEYLGYEVRLDPEGWSHAQHPHRYDFHLRSVRRMASGCTAPSVSGRRSGIRAPPGSSF